MFLKRIFNITKPKNHPINGSQQHNELIIFWFFLSKRVEQLFSRHQNLNQIGEEQWPVIKFKR